MSPRFSTDVPSRIPGMRRVSIRSRGKGTGVNTERWYYTVWDGQVQTAYSDGGKPHEVGETPMATWDSAAGTYILSSRHGDPPRSIELVRLWQLNTDSDSHNLLDMHPTQDWIATVRRSGSARTLEVWNWITETLVSSRALTSGNKYDVKWCPLGCHLAVAGSTTPFVHAYPVDEAGVIGVAVADPATTVSAEGDTVVWHPGHIAIYVNNTSGDPDPIAGWPFTVDLPMFGTEFTPPSEVAGWGGGSGTYGGAQFANLGMYTPEPAMQDLRGLAIAPDGTALVCCPGDGAVNYLMGIMLDPDGSFQARYDSLYTLIYGDDASGSAPIWPEFCDDGEVIIWGNANSSGVGSFAHGSPAYACEWEQSAFGPLISMPLGDANAGTGIELWGGTILYASRGPKWRPGTRHVVVPIQPNNEDESGNPRAEDPRLSLFVMESARFGYRLDWSPNDNSVEWDWEASRNLATGYLRVAWSPDGKHLLVGLGGTTSGGLTDTIAVFKVT